jgi:phosphopantothenoylcysteine decarboxylase/phosphopantothenate--cysteine ligase
MAHVLLCVGGSIAAYKACDLASKLVQAGHVVDVAMTRAAQRFVRPLSFAALTHRAVFTDKRWFEAEGAAQHLKATEAAQLVVVAPATAHLLALLAHGMADEIVSASVLGSRAPLLLAPAMNTRMWENPRVKANVATLVADGATLVGPGSGYLAEAERGVGRMAEPAEILAAALARLAPPPPEKRPGR